MIPFLLATAVVASAFTQAQGSGIQITVDASRPDASVQQVTYRRGEVFGFDSGTPAGIAKYLQGDVASAGINLVTATLNFSSPSDEGYFDYSPRPSPSLTPDFSSSSSVMLNQTLVAFRNALPDMPAVVQFSGTPSAYYSQVNTKYSTLCGAQGNFYGLPVPKAIPLVQQAISSWVAGISGNITNLTWIGSQEPTHTLGFSTDYVQQGQSCSNPPNVTAGIVNNINRFISYWTPIAKSIESDGMKTGGIQPNAADARFYNYTAQQIINAGMPLDYFTIQNYSPSLAVVQAAYSAWQLLQSTPKYRSTKVFIDRYGLDLTQSPFNGQPYNFTSILGITQFLIFESQWMQYANMLYGYAIETAALHPPPGTGTSLLPSVLSWLQNASEPLRPLTSTAPSSVSGFALIQTSHTPSGSIAIWNNGTTSTAGGITVTVTGYPRALSSDSISILYGSAQTQTVSEYSTSGLKIGKSSIGGLSLNPNEFFLISI